MYNNYNILFVHSSKMKFTLLSSSDMQRLAHVHVVNKALYLQDNSREPALYGVLDRRMVSVCCILIVWKSCSQSLKPEVVGGTHWSSDFLGIPPNPKLLATLLNLTFLGVKLQTDGY